MRFISATATAFAVFFTALFGAKLLTSYMLDRTVSFVMRDLIEVAIAAAVIAVGRTILGKGV